MEFDLLSIKDAIEATEAECEFSEREKSVLLDLIVHGPHTSVFHSGGHFEDIQCAIEEIEDDLKFRGEETNSDREQSCTITV